MIAGKKMTLPHFLRFVLIDTPLPPPYNMLGAIGPCGGATLFEFAGGEG